MNRFGPAGAQHDKESPIQFENDTEVAAQFLFHTESGVLRSDYLTLCSLLVIVLTIVSPLPYPNVPLSQGVLRVSHGIPGPYPRKIMKLGLAICIRF